MTIRYAILLGHLLIVSPLHAQNYPYCAQYSDGSSLDCSFSTLSMCNQSVSGVGGISILNPRAPGPSAADAGPPPFNATYLPPPPIQQRSSGPLALPNAPRQCNPVVDGTYCATAAALLRKPSRRSRAFRAIWRSALIRRQRSARSLSTVTAQIA